MSQSDRVYCRLVLPLFSLFADGSRRGRGIYPAREKGGAAFVIRFNGSLSPFALFEFSIDQKRPPSDHLPPLSVPHVVKWNVVVWFGTGRSGRGVFCYS